MTPHQLRTHLIVSYPESRLELLTSSEQSEVQLRYPWLPAAYLNFLGQIGYGSIGDARYRIYQGPIDPDAIFDAGTASDLRDVFLLGDDYAGTHEAFSFCDGTVRFGYIDSARPMFEEHPHAGMLEFILDWYGGKS
jgi:hypothetical protein